MGEPLQPQDVRRFRVLLVDDNRDHLETFAMLAEVEGFEVRTAAHPEHALGIAQEFVPHIYVLDIGMPRVNGYELAQAIRALHGSGPILIAATGYTTPAAVSAAMNAGFDRHIAKPYDPGDLIAIMRATCEARVPP